MQIPTTSAVGLIGKASVVVKYKQRILNQLQVVKNINTEDRGSMPLRYHPTKVGSVNVETYEA